MFSVVRVAAPGAVFVFVVEFAPDAGVVEELVVVLEPGALDAVPDEPVVEPLTEPEDDPADCAETASALAHRPARRAANCVFMAGFWVGDFAIARGDRIVSQLDLAQPARILGPAPAPTTGSFRRSPQADSCRQPYRSGFTPRPFVGNPVAG